MIYTIKDLKDLIRNMPDDTIVLFNNCTLAQTCKGFDRGFLTKKQIQELNQTRKISSNDIEIDGGWNEIKREVEEDESTCLIIYL
jgi:hypothetical protein